MIRRITDLARCLFLASMMVWLNGCSSNNDEVAVATPAAQAQVEQTASADSEERSEEDTGEAPVKPKKGKAQPKADGDDDTGGDAEGDSGDDSGADGEAMTESADAEDASDTSTDGDGGGNAARAAAVVKAKTLKEQAFQAFSEGKEMAAYRLLQAHLLTSDTEATDLLKHYRWSPSRRQPQLGIRIAVGVDLTSPPSEKQDFKPIGSLHDYFTKSKTTKSKSTTAARVRNQDGSDDDLGSERSPTLASTNTRERVLQKYAGLMGDVLVDHARKLHSEGKIAPVFQSLSGVATSSGRIMRSGGGDGDGDGTDSSDDGGDGSINISMSNSNSTLDTRIEGDELKYVSLGPALSYIGLGTAAELAEKAQAGEFDALILFEVEVTVKRSPNMIYNECRAKVINLADGKVLAASKLLKNTDAQKEIDRVGKTFVEGAMKPVLNYLDEKVAMVDIPIALTPELIKTKRLTVLLDGTPRPKLSALGEVRLYREKTLLEPSDVNQAYESILGPDDGKSLAVGTEEARLEIVKKLLNGS
ncbi:MAG: hypothetical protein SGI77_19795 [Pirellulaceae bacterium]|nr:hypothetical protein [Pirellulaceae bacterium]